MHAILVTMGTDRCQAARPGTSRHPGDALIVTNPGILAARLVQDRHAKPVATLLLQPGLLPSVCAPPVMPAVPLPQWAPRWAGHIYWRMVDAAGDLLIGRELNRVRDSLGLPPVRRLFRWWLSPQLVIGMFQNGTRRHRPIGRRSCGWRGFHCLTGERLPDCRPTWSISARRQRRRSPLPSAPP